MTASKTNTLLPSLRYADNSEFGIIHKEDTSTQAFLSSFTNMKPHRWSYVRNVFTGRDDVTLTIVDKCVDTPFRCLILALFIKQLSMDFSFGYRKIRIYVTPLPSEKHIGTVAPDERFGTTIQRNTFLAQCVKRMNGIEPTLKCKRFIINKRDSKLSTKDFNLFVRVAKGISHGWCIDSDEYSSLTPRELLDRHEHDIPCFNIESRSGHQDGILLNLDLQPNFK